MPQVYCIQTGQMTTKRFDRDGMTANIIGLEQRSIFGHMRADHPDIFESCSLFGHCRKMLGHRRNTLPRFCADQEPGRVPAPPTTPAGRMPVLASLLRG